MSGNRKLAAILAADVVGYSRLMGVDEEGTLARLRAHRRALVDPKIKEHHGAHLWADHFDGERRTLPELQIDVTSRIYRELIGTAGRRIEQERRVDPDAQDYTMRGRAASIRLPSRENNQAARGFFERALEIDGRSTDAMMGLAGVLVSDVLDGWSTCPDTDRARAEVLIRHALDLDPNSAEAHVVKGLLLKSQNRLEDALNAFETAIALERNNTGALFQIGMVLTNLGRPAEAVPQIEKSMQLNPRAVGLATRLYALGYAHLMLGHVDEAIDLLRRARVENPGLNYVHFALAVALGLKGNIEEAKLELAEAIRLKPEFNTLKRIVAGVPYFANPKGWVLREKTINVGLRNAGLPDE